MAGIQEDGDWSHAETGTGAIIKSLVEVSPFFFLAGMGMVTSGALLDHVAANMQVFKDVPSLLILVPALLGLKGNLEMTLGARLGSHANKKELEAHTFWPIVRCNLLAVQCQAIIVGAVASVLAVVENYVQSRTWDLDHALLLAASAITAASVASLLLSSLMIGIVVVAVKKGIDPDNISAPIAGMLGDFCTLGIVVIVANGLYSLPQAVFRYLAALVAAYLVLAGFCFVGAYRSSYTREIMVWGWPPVIASMILSNLSGPISEASIQKFSTFALFQVVMNGAGGNLGAIFCSKLSTDLMLAESEFMPQAEPLLPVAAPYLPGPYRAYSKALMTECKSLRGPYRSLSKALPNMAHVRQTSPPEAAQLDPHNFIATSWVEMASEPDYLKNAMSMTALTGPGDMARFARMLLLLILPGQMLFSCIVVGAASGWTALPSPLFLASFILASLAQVLVLLVAARQVVVVLWRKRLDPDNFASPLICGLGDLIGTSFMTMAFMVVSRFHGEAWPGNL